MAIGTTNLYIDIGGDKGSDTTRIHRASLVGTMATATTLYKADPIFKDSIDKLVQAGVDLEAAESLVAQMQAALTLARSNRDATRKAYDKVHGVCAAKVESHSTTAEDVQSYGFSVFAKISQGLVPPSGILTKYDIKKGIIRIRVLYLSVRCLCAIEISPDPADPSTFKRLEGTGRTRTLYGYPKGTWWIRAASLRAQEKSDWFGPVAVIVK